MIKINSKIIFLLFLLIIFMIYYTMAPAPPGRNTAPGHSPGIGH